LLLVVLAAAGFVGVPLAPYGILFAALVAYVSVVIGQWAVLSLGVYRLRAARRHVDLFVVDGSGEGRLETRTDSRVLPALALEETCRKLDRGYRSGGRAAFWHLPSAHLNRCKSSASRP
jgi:hypothetical protein